jgi:hypothetical protein
LPQKVAKSAKGKPDYSDSQFDGSFLRLLRLFAATNIRLYETDQVPQRSPHLTTEFAHAIFFIR